MGEFIIGVFFGFVLSFAIVVNTNKILVEVSDAVEECETGLPRDKSCKRVITAIEVLE